MHWFSAILLIVCGILGAATAIAKKRPDAQQVIDALTPYQGWIGIVALFWGLWGIISSFISYLGLDFIFFLVYLVAMVLQTALGFIMGFPLLQQWFLSKNPNAEAKAMELKGKLMNFQIPMGWGALIAGPAIILVWIIFV
jgi:hypothetical protein